MTGIVLPALDARDPLGFAAALAALALLDDHGIPARLRWTTTEPRLAVLDAGGRTTTQTAGTLAYVVTSIPAGQSLPGVDWIPRYRPGGGDAMRMNARPTTASTATWPTAAMTGRCDGWAAWPLTSPSTSTATAC